MELAAWLERQIEERGLSIRAAALYAGLSAPTLLRIMEGKPPDTTTCRKLAAWAAVDPDLVLALAGHRQMKPPAETTRAYAPEVIELMNVIAALPPELQAAALRITRRTIEDLQGVALRYSGAEEERLERAGKAA